MEVRQMAKKGLYGLTIALLLVSSIFTPVHTIASANGTVTSTSTETDNYEIYPLPQNEKYLGTDFTITDVVNIVIDPTVDESTRDFLTKILEAKSIKGTFSDQVVSDKTNIVIGIKDSTGSAENFINTNVEYDSAILNEIDGYVLNIDKELEEKGTIAILGSTTDAAYYALATLKMILNQIPGKSIKSVKYEDFADSKWRGFIEGFYGFPWSHEDRISLMKFGGEFKMNSYIFAPKDDLYHNSAWRTPYPAEELVKIKELVDAGHESKTQFIWAIHPGFNMIKWNDYENELQTLLNKLDQLYDVGVRQFGLFMDDISTAQSLTDKDKHVKLITDVANWLAAKGDVKPLIYCPPFYNQGWTGENGKPYLRALAAVPENVEIMWTGRSVVGSVNTTDMQWPKDLHGRDPYMWLNWPVNDYKDSRLMLGKGEVLQPGTHNIAGVVSNPMGHAELSKIALFAVADFTWNSDDFNDDESWLDSFKYVAPEVASELNTIAYHLSDPAPSGHGLQVGESENIKAALELFLKKFSKGESIQEVGNQLIAEFDKVSLAINDFKEKSLNKNMVEEIEPWLNSLGLVIKSAKSSTEAAIALQNNDLNSTWEGLAKAVNSMSASEKFTIKKLKYPDVTVEAGTKRLVPYANELIKILDTRISLAIDPEFTNIIPMSSYGSLSSLDRMVDGDLGTNTYIQTVQKNGDWYGVDFGKSINVHDIEIIQGRTDGDHDIFQRGVLEYSNDMETWTAIGEERSGFKIIEKGLDLEARYVRYRLTHAGIPGGKPDLWTAIREFSVNANKGKAEVYTNVSGLTEIDVAATDETIELSGLKSMTLKPEQYIGIQLPSIEHVVGITLESTDSNLVLESSENGVEWKKVTVDGPYDNAAYLRLMNKEDDEITVNVSKLLIKIQKFSEPKISHNYESIYSGNVNNLFDGKLEAKTWFGGMQNAGKYVQIDMGGIVNVQNVAVVINDGEGDYFREGDLQISIDGSTWETIHSFTNPSDRSLNFPEHEVPYRYKRVEVDEKSARYVRIISTKTHNSWLALNEIIVNEGLEKPGTENLALKVEPQGVAGSEAINAIDQRLSTFYTPKGEPQAGSLNYKLSKNTEISQVILLQDPSAISGAAVSVRDENGWHRAGTLSQSFNNINTARYKHVLEIKIVWDGNVKPIINEIIPVKRDGKLPRVQIDQLDEELQLAYSQGLIMNEGILNSLLSKVSNIQEHQTSKEALNMVSALENQVMAQSGKKLDEGYTKLLLEITAELKKYISTEHGE
ncbi:beta-N-acetylglucosaminidase domain-containing protein [Neobacillus sp. FSL H8-0543]|uniref:beta-N-acetylglucosaminidase domain-containing protein n=1 Tax=Neobacillus sp. FSL H8-0543 TaxID=2954672 RepID=UPI003158CFF9